MRGNMQYGEYSTEYDYLTRGARIAARLAEDDQRQILLNDLNKRWGDIVARGKAKAKDATVNPAADLIAALDFIKSAIGEGTYEHIRFENGAVIASDGKMSAGVLLPGNDLNCCPRYEELLGSLRRATGSVAFTVAPGCLTVTSGRLTVRVPCLGPGDLPRVVPQGARAPVDDRLRKAFAVAGTLASEAAKDPIAAALLLDNSVCTATDRRLMVQYYHGIHLPPRMRLPKRFTAAVCKTPKEMTGLGFEWSDAHDCVSSVTIWFKDNSFIKSICYFDPWPIEQINNIFNVALKYEATPEGFFEGAEILAEFTETGQIMLNENNLSTAYINEQGSNYEVPGLKGKYAFNADYLKEICPWTTELDYVSCPDMLYFRGDKQDNNTYNIRGVLCGMTRKDRGQPISPLHIPSATWQSQTDLDDEIPY